MALTTAERSKRWRERHPAKAREHSAVFYEKRRSTLRKLKEQPCGDCEVQYPSFVMEWHHRDPNEKLFTIAEGWQKNLDSVLAEIEKCDLLCANCHRIREHSVGL